MSTLYHLDSYVRGHLPRRRRDARPSASVPNGKNGKNGNGKPSTRYPTESRAPLSPWPAANRGHSPSQCSAASGCWRCRARSTTKSGDRHGAAAADSNGVLGHRVHHDGGVARSTFDVDRSDARHHRPEMDRSLQGRHGASAEQEAELWAASGLVAEPLASHTLESWEGLLRTYGPLAVIVDVDPSDKRAMHVLLITGIHGDGTADGTTATIVDPARGDKRPVKFSAFLSQYQQGAAREPPASATTKSSTGPKM